MTKYFIVVAHPEPKSFNHALAAAAIAALTAAGHEVRTTYLVEEGFSAISGRHNFTSVKNPDFLKLQLEEQHAVEHRSFAPDVQAEMDKLAWCDVLIFQFPLWWFHLPAVLKGWCDRVLAMGFAYGGGKFYANGPFHGKKAMLSLTTGGPLPAYQPGAFNGDIDGILRPIHRGIFEFCGFSVLKPNVCWSVAHLTDDERKTLLESWRVRCATLDAEAPIVVGTYA